MIKQSNLDTFRMNLVVSFSCVFFQYKIMCSFNNCFQFICEFIYQVCLSIYTKQKTIKLMFNGLSCVKH